MDVLVQASSFLHSVILKMR